MSPLRMIIQWREEVGAAAAAAAVAVVTTTTTEKVAEGGRKTEIEAALTVGVEATLKRERNPQRET